VTICTTTSGASTPSDRSPHQVRTVKTIRIAIRKLQWWSSNLSPGLQRGARAFFRDHARTPGQGWVCDAGIVRSLPKCGTQPVHRRFSRTHMSPARARMRRPRLDLAHVNAVRTSCCPVLRAVATLDRRRLREIPYNYTSFADREIVIRLLGPEAGRCLTTCAPSVALAVGPHALRGAGRHLGRPAQSISRADLSTTHAGARCSSRRCITGCEIEKRRDPGDPCAMQGRKLWKRPNGRARIRRHLRHGRCIARRARRAFASHTAQRQRLFDSSQRPHRDGRTDWRVESLRRAGTRHRGEIPGCAGLHRDGTHDHPRAAGHRLHGQRRAADAFRAVITPRSSSASTRSSPGLCPAWRSPCRPVHGSRRVTRRVEEAPPRLASSLPWIDFSRRFLCRRQHRDERGRQKACSGAPALDNLAWWRMVGPTATGLKSPASHNLGKIQRRRDSCVRTRLEGRTTAADTARVLRTERLEIPGGVPQGRARQGRQDKFLGGPGPASRRKVRRGIITSGAGCCNRCRAQAYRVPRVLRPARGAYISLK